MKIKKRNWTKRGASVPSAPLGSANTLNIFNIIFDMCCGKTGTFYSDCYWSIKHLPRSWQNTIFTQNFGHYNVTYWKLIVKSFQYSINYRTHAHEQEATILQKNEVWILSSHSDKFYKIWCFVEKGNTSKLIKCVSHVS